MLYEFMDRYIWHDFTNDILYYTKQESKSPIVVFDIGCFIGNFSRKIKKKFPDGSFFLFDPNPNLKINDFNHYKLALSKSDKKRIYYLNNFFPGGGSSLSPNGKNDFWWNLTRKIITLKFWKTYSEHEVNSITLDKFCEENKIKYIDILKIDVDGTELEVLQGGDEILNQVKIALVEVNDTKSKFEEKFAQVKNLLEDKYNFKLIKQKKMWSVSIFSNLKVVDTLFVKTD
tara:strand:- start:2755 stop:3444 length:690 start_codon:yes stop_codon:yes gene_type:complete